MNKIYLIFVIGLMLVGHSFAGEWYQGGTLHNTTIGKWYKATYQNRLATSSDWIVVVVDKKNHGTLFKNNMKLLRRLSEQLEKCVTDGNKENGEILIPSIKTSESASFCWQLMQN